jgi:hypothetical protein
MGRSVHACRVLEARVVRDAELAPVVCIRLYAPYPCPARARVRCSLCRLRVCMCVYDTDAEDISKARTRTIKPQNHDSAALERLVDLRHPNTDRTLESDSTLRSTMCRARVLSMPHVPP